MIRIITEAKADFDRFIQLCSDVTAKKFQKVKTGDGEEEWGRRYREYYQRKIDQFNKVKGNASPPYNDITYWYKAIKDAHDKGNGLNMIETFEAYIDGIMHNAEFKKQFRNIFPSSLVRRFEKYKNMLPIQDQLYSTWVREYTTSTENGQEELEQKLRKMLKDVAGYSEEEMQEINKGAELLYNKDGWKIYRITEYLTAEYYGQGTGWCICGNYPGSEYRGIKHFNDYIVCTDPDGYFFALCDDGRKFCFFFGSDGFEAWDGTDGRDDEKSALPLDFPQDFAEWFYKEFGMRLRILKPTDTEEQQREVIMEFLQTNGASINWVFYSHNPKRLSLEALVEGFVQYKGMNDKEAIRFDLNNEIKANPFVYSDLFNDLWEYCDENGIENEATQMKLSGFYALSSAEARQLLQRHIDEIVAYYLEYCDTFYEYIEKHTEGRSLEYFVKSVLAEEFNESLAITESIMLSGQGKQMCDIIQNM